MSLPALTLLLACDGSSRAHATRVAVDSSATAVGSTPSTKPSATVEPTAKHSLTIQHAKPVGKSAVVDQKNPQAWAKGCRIHRPCAEVGALPRCSADTKPLDANQVAASPPVRPGSVVAIRGALGLAMVQCGMVGCWTNSKEQRCCNGCGMSVVVGGQPNAIELEGFRCRGDESRLCCDVPAFGQTIVATGTLVPATYRHSYASIGWALSGASLCTEGHGP